ncbi:MAG: TetR/AcrR family transcriptional regulator [Desulfitobacteriaceae bacterium]
MTILESSASINKREQIIDVATMFFWGKGYNGTSMRNIASEVGMMQAGLYYYFSSKEEILYEVLDKGINDLLRDGEPIYKLDLPPMEKCRLMVYTHAYKTLISSQGQLTDTLRIFTRESQNLNPEHRVKYVEKRDRYEGFLRDIIKECVEQGVFVRVDYKLTTFAIFGMCNWLMNWYRGDGELSSEYLANYWAYLVCDVFLAKFRPTESQ